MRLPVRRHPAFGQLVRYGVLGLALNVAGYLLYLLVTALWMQPKPAMSVLYAIGVVLSFAGNRRWTFSHDGAPGGSFLRFACAHVLGYLLNYALLATFVDRLGYPHQAVQAVAIVVVALVLFVLFRYFVFPSRRATEGGMR